MASYDQLHPTVPSGQATALPSGFLSMAQDPDLEWIRKNPDRALAYFFVNPHPCAGFEEIMKL